MPFSAITRSKKARRVVAAESGVEQHELAAGPDRGDREGIIEFVRTDPAGGQAPLAEDDVSSIYTGRHGPFPLPFQA
jgi:hypothetical protein